MTLITACGQSYLDFEFIADVAAIEFRADKFKLPVKESLCVPIPVADQVQNLFIVRHGVNPCGQRQALTVCQDYSTEVSIPSDQPFSKMLNINYDEQNSNVIQQMSTNIQQLFVDAGG